MKLTQRAKVILKAMQNGARAGYMPYRGRFNPEAYYFIDGVIRCTREMTTLIKHGLVSEERVTHTNYQILLTEEGKNFVSDLEEYYDVWVVDNDFSLKVNKYSGYINKKSLVLQSGTAAKETYKRTFFTDRGEAFKKAIEIQEHVIKAAQMKVDREKKYLEDIKKHLDDPSLDESGYI